MIYRLRCYVPLQRTMRGAVHGFRKRGIATPHHAVVGAALAEAVCGGDADLTDTLTEQQLLDLDRAPFISCVWRRRRPRLARIELRAARAARRHENR
jgi:3-hydroxyacyl-CoA dehydrogenase